MLGLEAWHLWIIAGIILIILEIFVSDFFLALIGLAAFATVFAAAAGLEFIWQLAIFVAMSAVFLVAVRPMAKSWIYRRGSDTSSNVDALVGQNGIVSTTICGRDEPGRVRLGSETWRAITEDDSVIEEGSKIEVLRVDSATLVVRLKALSNPQDS